MVFTLGRGRGERQVLADQATERSQIDRETLGLGGRLLGWGSRRAVTRQMILRTPGPLLVPCSR